MCWCDPMLENRALFPKRKLRGIRVSWHKAGVFCQWQQSPLRSKQGRSWLQGCPREAICTGDLLLRKAAAATEP